MEEVTGRAVAKEREARRAALLDRQDAWAVEHHLGNRKTVQTNLVLSDKQMCTAIRLGILVEMNLPHRLREGPEGWARGECYPLRDLTAEEIAAIDHETLLTRLQAAERLDMTPAEFDRCRKKHGLLPASTILGDSGWRTCTGSLRCAA